MDIFRRSALLATLAFLFAATAQSTALAAKQRRVPVATGEDGSFVEFLIGDRLDPKRKWGHVSLRVVDAAHDLIYDFGRYGQMWNKQAEGDPILRVWNKSYESYRSYHLGEGGTNRRFRFASNKARNAAIIAYYSRLTNGAKKFQSTKSWTAYYTKGRTFHAADWNCTVVSLEGFQAGFPEFNLRDRSDYSTHRTLEFAIAIWGSGKSEHWDKIWWPPDLMALLEEQYAAKGIAKTGGF